MKSARVASSNFAERIADPASQFHPDYLAYRNREITKRELIARLPHVALLGLEHILARTHLPRK